MVKLFSLKKKFRDTTLIANFLYLQTCTNDGFSLSMLASLSKQYILLIHTACLAVILIYLYLKKSQNVFTSTAKNLILAGALSNYIDRLSYGSIVDMFKVVLFGRTLFICNLADVFLSIGVAFGLLGSLDKGKPKSKFDKYGLERDHLGL